MIPEIVIMAFLAGVAVSAAASLRQIVRILRRLERHLMPPRDDRSP